MTATWAQLLSPEDRRRVDEVALRWGAARLSAGQVLELIDIALTAAAASYDEAGDEAFIVYALPVVRGEVRRAARGAVQAKGSN